MSSQKDGTVQIRVLPKTWHGNDVQVSAEVLSKGFHVPGAKYDPSMDLTRVLPRAGYSLPKAQGKKR